MDILQRSQVYAYLIYVGVIPGFRVVKKPALDCRDLELSPNKTSRLIKGIWVG